MHNNIMHATISLSTIGSIFKGVDGRDEYVLLTRADDDLTPDDALEYLHPLVYREGRGAGSYYCDRVHAVPAPGRMPNQVLCVVEHRFDV
jgi:hypothetical protein